MNESAKIVQNFNSSLKVLARDLAGRYPADAKMDRARKRVVAIIDLEPMFVINTVGPHLYKYRDQIYALNTTGAENFFLENSFDSETEDGGDMVNYVITKLKECARNLPEAEKDEYKEIVINLLDDYVEFLALKFPTRE